VRAWHGRAKPPNGPVRIAGRAKLFRVAAQEPVDPVPAARKTGGVASSPNANREQEFGFALRPADPLAVPSTEDPDLSAQGTAERAGNERDATG